MIISEGGISRIAESLKQKKVKLNIARNAGYAERLLLLPSHFCTVQSYNEQPQ